MQAARCDICIVFIFLYCSMWDSMGVLGLSSRLYRTVTVERRRRGEREGDDCERKKSGDRERASRVGEEVTSRYSGCVRVM